MVSYRRFGTDYWFHNAGNRWICYCIRGSVDGYWFSGDQLRCCDVKLPPRRWWRLKMCMRKGRRQSKSRKMKKTKEEGQRTAISAREKKWKGEWRRGVARVREKINEKRTKRSRSGKKCIDSTGDYVEKEVEDSLKSYMLWCYSSMSIHLYIKNYDASLLWTSSYNQRAMTTVVM